MALTIHGEATADLVRWSDGNAAFGEAAVSGSTRCLNPAGFGITWRSCIHTCR